MAITHQADTTVEAFRPIRRGAVAIQPVADISALLFLGLAALLPADLRALCSCAGLFFARVAQIDGESYHLEVAALPHYFSPAHPRRAAHVRTLTLSSDAFAHLLEYERALVGKATCDVRELVEEHDTEITRSQHAAASETEHVSHPAPTPEQQPVGVDAHSQEDAANTQEKEEADLEILTQVYVSGWHIQQIFADWHIEAKRDRRIQSALLQAAFDSLDDPVMQQRITRVRQWRRRQWNKGYGWQRVVTIEPQGAGWNLVIGTPMVTKTA